MCGIFAYLNYNVSRERRYILEVLFNGLRRLEYRGYDSSGIAVDADRRPAPSSSASPSDAPYAGPPPLVFRQEGKIENLVRSVYSGQFLNAFHPGAELGDVFSRLCFDNLGG
jgi:glucosamine--fructose-6-phosphate aminotransferase (isomerizing)